MAGFAILLSVFVETGARFDSKVNNGQLETNILEQALKVNVTDNGMVINTEVQNKITMLASCCTKILVWHTRTAKPWKYFEGKFLRDHPNLEV